MNLVDSSAWLEYFADGPNAQFFAPAIERVNRLVVPSIILLEVFKRVLVQRNEGDAFQAVALMQQGQVVDLDASLALSAAKLGLEFKIPLADSLVLATAREYNAVLWTQDAHFEGLDRVKFRGRKSR